MKPVQKIAAVVLVVLLAASVYGLLRTGQRSGTPVAGQFANSTGTAQAPLVDQTPLLTAQRLARMPNGSEEEPFAKEALRLADHHMDLAYAAAERDAEEHPPVMSAQAKEILAGIKEAEDALDAANALVARLTAEDAKATGAKKDTLDDQLVLATAHQEEHQDEVDDAKADLERAGGDPKSRIEAMMQEHKASSQATDALHVSISAVAEERGLIHRFGQWMAFHQKQLLFWQAKQEAELASGSLSARHDAVQAQVDARKRSSSPSGGQASPTQQSVSGRGQAAPSHEDSTAF